jgi:hypothetical protein
MTLFATQKQKSFLQEHDGAMPCCGDCQQTADLGYFDQIKEQCSYTMFCDKKRQTFFHKKLSRFW